MTFENDEFFDEFYSTTCPKCNENSVDQHMPMCDYCWLNELADSVSHEDMVLEMSLSLDY
jgi:hypothetical protein